MQPNQGDNPPAQPLPEVTALLQALRQVKASKNLSLDAFTHDTGYSRSSWNRVLKGTAFPPRTAVERLCSRRGLDKNTLLGLWDTADQARRAADAQEEAPSEAVPVPAPAAPAQGVPDPTPPTAPDPVPPTAADPVSPTAPGPAPSAASDPAPGTATPKPAAVSPASAPSTPGPVEPAKPATASRSRIKILALIAAALAALLLVGRWYSVHETKTPAVSHPETGGDNRPGDDQPVVDETPLPSKSSTAPTQAPKDDKKKDQDSTGEEDTKTKSPRPSSSAKGETSSSPSAPVSPSTAASPGAAGRASCRYNWDRTQVMAKGMVGSKVKQIQCLLNSNYDYTLTVDGKFGESTDVAVRAVQSCSGLKPDGQVGPQTWKYLDTPMAGCGH
ncbi:peptidoglycan-binding protein [Streptomyces sp. NBC_00984]|uniref:peptidoglycan-binding protein n=1 Tax=Streptomyces sp. NBC_00984 TaxID=2903700 RepID=UPI00386B19FA|nr:peptidoglycan-binding protein [Streptomyces sp. NBC_00984]